MGSGKFVGGFRGWRGTTEPVGGSIILPKSRMAGGIDGWNQPVLQTAGAGGCLPSGTVVIDSGLIPAEHTINSNVAVGADVWVEVAGLGFAALNPACMYKIVVTLDAQDIHAGDDDVINAYVGPPGAVSATGFDSIPPGIATVGANITNVYASYTLTPGTDTFNGPGAAESVYIWPGVNFPLFQGSEVKYKNLRIVVKAA